VTKISPGAIFRGKSPSFYAKRSFYATRDDRRETDNAPAFLTPDGTAQQIQ
jgi:hypothetical protein